MTKLQDGWWWTSRQVQPWCLGKRKSTYWILSSKRKHDVVIMPSREIHLVLPTTRLGQWLCSASISFLILILRNRISFPKIGGLPGGLYVVSCYHRTRMPASLPKDSPLVTKIRRHPLSHTISGSVKLSQETLHLLRMSLWFSVQHLALHWGLDLQKQLFYRHGCLHPQISFSCWVLAMPQLQYCKVHAPHTHKMCTRVLMDQVGFFLDVYTPQYIQWHEFDPANSVQKMS